MRPTVTGAWPSCRMKLLFDENLSPALVRLLLAKFPGSQHVRDLGLKGQPDEDIWEHALRHGFTLLMLS